MSGCGSQGLWVASRGFCSSCEMRVGAVEARCVRAASPTHALEHGVLSRSPPAAERRSPTSCNNEFKVCLSVSVCVCLSQWAICQGRSAFSPPAQPPRRRRELWHAAGWCSDTVDASQWDASLWVAALWDAALWDAVPAAALPFIIGSR